MMLNIPLPLCFQGKHCEWQLTSVYDPNASQIWMQIGTISLSHNTKSHYLLATSANHSNGKFAMTSTLSDIITVKITTYPSHCWRGKHFPPCLARSQHWPASERSKRHSRSTSVFDLVDLMPVIKTINLIRATTSTSYIYLYSFCHINCNKSSVLRHCPFGQQA